MPPRSGPSTPQPPPLTPVQRAHFQEFMRQRAAQTGNSDVSKELIQEWMASQTNQIQRTPQQDPQAMEMARQRQAQANAQHAQAQAQAHQQQANFETVIAHLFPPHLASNPPAAVAHLQAILFPPGASNAPQSPLLQQVMVLAKSSHLTADQMSHLKNAVATRSNGQTQQQAPPSNSHPQQYAMQPQPQQYAAHAPPVPTPGVAPASAQANQAIHSLQARITGLEGLLGRGDINDEQRARGQAELETARANLQRVVQGFLAQQRAAVSGPGAPQQRTASPSQFTQPSLAHQPPRPSPAASPPAEKKLTKKELDKIALDQQRQQQAALVAAQQAAQAKKVAAPPTQYAPAPPPPPSIPPTLSMPKPEPESFQPPRPTLSQGLANAPVVASPAIIQHSGLGQQVVQDALGRSAPGKEVARKDTRPDSTGRTVSKRKLRDLVESVDPEERLSDDVEELMLSIADEFIDSITRFGCQLAKHRKSDRLEVKDLALHLDRNYGIKIPGFAPEEARTSQSRRAVIPPGYQSRLAAVRESKRR